MPKIGFKHSPESKKKMSEKHKGHITTEEHKRKISERTKGEKNPNFGKHHPPEIRKIISDAAKRQWENPETKERALKGLKKRSENPEWKRNLSIAKKGKPGPAQSLETRHKHSVALKGRPFSDVHRKNIGKSRKGTKHSIKSRKQMSEKRKGVKHSEEHNRNIGKSNKGLKRSEDFKKKIRGENSHLWKGGKTTLYLLIRSCAKYYQWRDTVFKRDNYCDCFSGVKGNGNLNAHHIIPFNKILSKYKIKTIEQAMDCEALWDVNNGVTMIDTSHEAYHQMWGN
jgi:hypothetical protein